MWRCLFPLFLTLPGTVASMDAIEDLEAPPAVTAQAWVISDAASGEILWDHQGDEPRKAASTAKIMAALVVLRLAKEDPAVLDEELTVSKLAAATAGSTAGLKEGERVRAGDALYGLLLPSGNDAGNALGEHFHPHFDPPSEAMLAQDLASPLIQSRLHFIAEMNRVAQEIGLDNTIYRSAFGDGGTADDRTTTAHDLARLAHVAMRDPLFRKLVATLRHEASIHLPGGTTRTASWENTNELLELDLGYDGIKTGVTTQAGHCLVASGQHGTDRLLVVVLGCASGPSRFADARNLFRWAWTRRKNQ